MKDNFSASESNETKIAKSFHLRIWIRFVLTSMFKGIKIILQSLSFLRHWLQVPGFKSLQQRIFL